MDREEQSLHIQHGYEAAREKKIKGLQDKVREQADRIAELGTEVEKLNDRLMVFSRTSHQRDVLLQKNAKLIVENEKLRAHLGWERLRNL